MMRRERDRRHPGPLTPSVGALWPVRRSRRTFSDGSRSSPRPTSQDISSEGAAMDRHPKRSAHGSGWIAVALALVLAGGAAAQQPAELLVRGGTVVNAGGRMTADVRIRNGVIAEVGPNLAPGSARVIDAT